MRFGVVLPSSEIGTDPNAIAEFARTAEQLGFGRLSAYDHVLGAEHAGRTPALSGPYTEHTPFHEPLVLFGFIAAHTTTIELATNVLVLPQRQTALVAKQAAEVALLTNGRFLLGVGSGWNHIEYRALGEEFGSRGRRLEEQVILLQHLWREPVVKFVGDWHDVDRAGIAPRPTRQIPILFGGSSEAAMKRAVRLGDGFIFRRTGPALKRDADTVQKLLSTAGRPIDNFQMDAFVDYSAGPAEWDRQIASWRARDGATLMLRTFDTHLDWSSPAPSGMGALKGHLEAMRTFASEVGMTG